MDFRPEHKDSFELILFDMNVAKDLLEVFLTAGVAQEVELAEVRRHSGVQYQVNGASISAHMVGRLIDDARASQRNSYAPYSHFNVGAAILAENSVGERLIFAGCNIENAAYGSTICAERTAAFKAVSEGFRKFLAYAVVGGFDAHTSKTLRLGAQKAYITPCGSCRQVTNEFEANPCVVIMAKETGKVYMTTLKYLLPGGFGPRALGVDASTYHREKKVG